MLLQAGTAFVTVWSSRKPPSQHLLLSTERRAHLQLSELDGRTRLKKIAPSGSKCRVPAAPELGPLNPSKKSLEG